MVLLSPKTRLTDFVPLFIGTKNGLGQHIENIDRPKVDIYHDTLLGIWVGELFYTFALAPAKLAFLAFYWRIFQVHSIKVPIISLSAIVAIWAIVRVCVVLFSFFFSFFYILVQNFDNEYSH